MKFFGYVENNKDELFQFSEVTLQAKPASLKSVASFLLKCAQEIEENEFWEHQHYSDISIDKSESVNFIVFKEYKKGLTGC